MTNEMRKRWSVQFITSWIYFIVDEHHDPALPGRDGIWRQKLYREIIFDPTYIGKNIPTVDKIKFGVKIYVVEVGRSVTETSLEECFQSRMRDTLKLVSLCRDIQIIWKKNISGRRYSTLSKTRSHQ